MSVEKYLEKHFYPWAKIELISKENKEMLYQGSVENCKNYLDKKVIPKPLNFSKDITIIEILI